MNPQLKPCPCCGSKPERFKVRIKASEMSDVIYCPKGCIPSWNSVVVHLRAVDVPGWDDVADAWNTITLVKGEDGRDRICFDRFPPGFAPPIPVSTKPKATPKWPRNSSPLVCWHCNKIGQPGDLLMMGNFPSEAYHDACVKPMQKQALCYNPNSSGSRRYSEHGWFEGMNESEFFGGENS